MRYKAAAFDYDETLAELGQVPAVVVDALGRLKSSGRKLLLVTGRELADLQTVFPEHHLFDRIVAENGAHIYSPADGCDRLLAQPADRFLVEELAERGVQPLFVGRCIIATHSKHIPSISQVIHEFQLEYAIIANKESAMALPTGVDKASGAEAALRELSVDPSNAVAFGDAENDEALLARCGFGVAVRNAVPALKVIANLVTEKERGFGVIEGIDSLLANEFAH